MEWEHPFGMGDHEPCGPSSYALLTNRWNLAFSLSLSFFIQQMILLAAMRTHGIIRVILGAEGVFWGTHRISACRDVVGEEMLHFPRKQPP